MCAVSNKENLFFPKVTLQVHFGPPAVTLWGATQIPPFGMEALMSPTESWRPMAHGWVVFWALSLAQGGCLAQGGALLWGQLGSRGFWMQGKISSPFASIWDISQRLFLCSDLSVASAELRVQLYDSSISPAQSSFLHPLKMFFLRTPPNQLSIHKSRSLRVSSLGNPI